jgi:MFS family permease
MKPSAEKKSKQQAFSNCMPGLEKLANSRANKHIESRPRSSTLVDLTSGMIPYPERVLMTTPCLRLDMAPGEDSDDSAESPENTRKEKVTKADKASPTKPTLDRLPSLGFSIYPTPQKGPGADMLPTKNSKKMGAGAGPQRRTETEMSSMKHNDTTTEIKEKGTAEKLPTRNITSETISDHKDSFRSKPNLKVDTPLENFSKTDTDAEKALPEEPEPVNSSPPGPPNGFLSSQMRRPREIGFVFLVCMLQLIPQAALTICFPISSTIAHTFHIQQPSVLPWMAAAYATTFGTFILISGRLGDIFGHKKLVIVGFIMMTPSSVVAGISPWVSPILFFVARAMQGVAASLMVPNGLALLGRTYAPGSKMKIIAFSLFGCCAPLGAYLGMLLAAIFVDFIGWQFVFFLLAGISLLCAITSKIVFIPPPPTPSQMKPFKEMLGDMDWLGAVTGVAGMICVQVAFVSAPSVGWGTSWIYMLLIIGALLIAGFVVVEIRVAEHPLIPFRMLRSDVAFVLAAVSCGWAVFGIWSW